MPMTGARLVLDMRHLKAFRAAGKSRPLDRRCRAGHLAAMDAADNGFILPDALEAIRQESESDEQPPNPIEAALDEGTLA